MEIKIFNKGFNYNQDGPGNRLVYFLQGCNLRCPWCTNPEGLSLNSSMIVIKEKLLGPVCPYGAINGNDVNRKKCLNCKGDCLTKFRNEGIRSSFKTIRIETIIEEIKDASFLFYGGGGVTFSGGEPTMQYNGLFSILYDLKKLGVNVALETNGTHPLLYKLFPYIDTLIIDIKHYEESKYNYLKGSLKNVLYNLQATLKEPVKLWIRITLIPGFNDSSIDIKSYIQLLEILPKSNFVVEFLTYHEYSKVKWEQCGYKYEFIGKKVPKEKVESYQKLMISNGIKLQIT